MDRDIPINRKKIPTSFFFVLIGAIVLADMTFFPEISISDSTFDRVSCGIGSAVLLIYAGVIMADFLKRRLDKNAAFRIMDTGIYDNLGIFSCGEIRWSDIAALEITSMFGVKTLLIKVHDPYKYLAGKNLLIRYQLKDSIKKWQTPIRIPAPKLDYDLDKLYEELSFLLNHHRVGLTTGG